MAATAANGATAPSTARVQATVTRSACQPAPSPPARLGGCGGLWISGLAFGLLLGLSYLGGCGSGSFKLGTVPTTSGLPAGQYLVQVVASDGSGSYYAQVPLTVVGQ